MICVRSGGKPKVSYSLKASAPEIAPDALAAISSKTGLGEHGIASLPPELGYLRGE
jgi:hypothetical protein